MTNKWSNILLVAGSGQNAGKTTFICQLLEANKMLNPIAIKVSPHVHAPTPGLRVLVEEENYQVFEETDSTSHKDSSRYLGAGASRSFHIKANDDQLQMAFIALLPYLQTDVPILIESAALHHVIDAGIFALVINKTGKQKPSTAINRKVADIIISSDGRKFSPPVQSIYFNTEWKINRI